MGKSKKAASVESNGVSFAVQEYKRASGQPGYLIVEKSVGGSVRYAGPSMAWSPHPLMVKFDSLDDAIKRMDWHKENVARMIASQKFIASIHTIDIPLCPIADSRAEAQCSVRMTSEERRAAVSLVNALQQIDPQPGPRAYTIPTAIRWILREIAAKIPADSVDSVDSQQSKAAAN